ncbi:hypothetical protein D3C81_1608650 [compost metagenome]
MKERRFHRHQQHRFRRFAVHRKAFQQLRISADRRRTIDPQRLANPRNNEQQRHPRIVQHIAQSIDAVVTWAIGQRQRAFVNDPHKPGFVTARRIIQAIGAHRADNHQRRQAHHCLIILVEKTDLLAQRSFMRQSVNRFQCFD